MQFAVLRNESHFLPHGNACISNEAVVLKINTHTILDWVTLCEGNWDTTPQSQWQLSFIGGESDTIEVVGLGLRVDPGGGCVLDRLVLSLTPSGITLLEQQVPDLARILPMLAVGSLSSPDPLPCANFFAGSFDDCEYSGGANNNGVGTIVSGSFVDMQFWPKREDRIRFDVLLGGTIVNFELDSQNS